MLLAPRDYVLDQGYRVADVTVRRLRAIVLARQGTLDEPRPSLIQGLSRPTRGRRLGGHGP